MGANNRTRFMSCVIIVMGFSLSSQTPSDLQRVIQNEMEEIIDVIEPTCNFNIINCVRLSHVS